MFAKQPLKKNNGIIKKLYFQRLNFGTLFAIENNKKI